MKILYVYGDDDFAAVAWEDLSKKEKKKIISLLTNFKHPVKFDKDSFVEMLEFGEVDPEFISFIRDNIQDYDHSKNVNFYEEPFI